jgi:zinc transporter ZupT
MTPSLPSFLVLTLPAVAVFLSFVVLILFPGLRVQSHRLLLSFSGAFLLGITLFELFPEVFAEIKGRQTGVFIALGILLQIVLEFFSRGAEHGHIHHKADQSGFSGMLFLSLGIHAFLEGIPLVQNPDVVWGISIHKIPVALIFGSFLLSSGRAPIQSWGIIAVFALMTPLGAVFGNLPVLQQVYPYLLALVIGMILHVSTIILFESSKDHAVNLKRFGVIVLGMFLAYLL